MPKKIGQEAAPFSTGNAVQQAPHQASSSSAILGASILDRFSLDARDPSESFNLGSKLTVGNRRELSATPSELYYPSAESPLVLQGYGSGFSDHFYDKEKGWRLREALSLVAGIFTCWSKSKEDARQHLNGYSAAALFEQTRLQQEALIETQDTRDMWEWQMEQQQAITSQEYVLLERNSMDNPLGALPGLVRNISASGSTNLNILGELTRNTSVHSQQESKSEGFTDAKSKGSPSGSDSPSWDLQSQLGSLWQDSELISAMMLIFESALLRCRSEVNFFCRIYMQQMVLSGYSLIRTLMEMEPRTVFLRKVHASYALEARVNNVLFRCFENDSFDVSGLTQIFDPTARSLARLQDYLRMKSVDPEEALRMHCPSYEPGFHAFCANKSEEIMAMFSWNMGYRTAAERDRFMEAFLRAAKWVWLLHRLAHATIPPMQIIRVGRGQGVNPLYVEAVAVPPIGSCENCPVNSAPKVEFMIMPGFISHRKVFRSKVYQHYMCKRSSYH